MEFIFEAVSLVGLGVAIGFYSRGFVSNEVAKYEAKFTAAVAEVKEVAKEIKAKI